MEFITDPWTVGLAQWTLVTILSAIIQLILIPVGLWLIYIAFDISVDIYRASYKPALWFWVIAAAVVIFIVVAGD